MCINMHHSYIHVKDIVSIKIIAALTCARTERASLLAPGGTGVSRAAFCVG